MSDPEIYKPPSLGETLDIDHGLEFDPTNGYTFSTLQQVTPPENPPADFAAFWQSTYAQAREADGKLDVALREIASPADDLRVYEIEYTSWDNYRVGGWLVEPSDAEPRGLMVVGHGYGGREAPDFVWSRRGYAALYPCARGFHRSAKDGWPSNAAEHVVRGIESRDGYILRGCVAELWHAGSVLIERHPNLASRLVYAGGSFGGGLGALMLPWDERFVRANLGVPTFGHHPIRLKCQFGGSGLSVRRYHEQHPEVVDVLCYYDASTAATFIKVPVRTQAALFDPGVCPAGQWSVANAIRSAGSQIDVIPCAHYEVPPGTLTDEETQTLERRSAAFLDLDRPELWA